MPCNLLKQTTIQEREAAKQLAEQKEQVLINQEATIQVLNHEVENLKEKLNEMIKKLSFETLNNKKALEKAITGSVRLCVVAPTVNVNVGDAKQKFKSK